MSSYKDLSAIFDRITNGEETEGDMQTLRQLLRARDGQNIVQVGSNIVNIAEGRDIQIGDRTYYGNDAEAIKQALRSVLQEKRKAERPRNERLLLQAVKNEVVARLKQSLHNAVLINLGKEAQPEQVKYPWSSDIKIGDKPSEPIPDTISILEVFNQEEIAGRLLILGNPGAGKTTTMLDLAKPLIARAEEEADYPIPVLFNLSSWKDDRQSMRDWLVAELKSKYGVRKDIGANWVDNAKLLPILDGLDELESVRQELCVHKINELLQSDCRPQYLVVCSRREEYGNYETRLQLNGAIYLRELNDAQIQEYLTAVGRGQLWQTLRQDGTLLDLVRKPLLLSITVLSTQELLVEDWQQLSSTQARLEHLLNAYVRRMLHRKLESKAYGRHKIPSKRQMLKWLVYLAQQLQQKSETEFLIEKIQPNWFPSEIQALIKFLENITLQFGLFNFISLVLVQKVRPVEQLKWSWRRAFKEFVSRPKMVQVSLVPIGISVLGGVLVDAFFCGWILEINLEDRTYPNKGIWSSLRNALASTLVTGAIVGILWMLGRINDVIVISAKPIQSGVMISLFCGLTVGMIFGGLACIQHLTLRLLLYCIGYIPWNYARFLDYCTERLFLQRVGGRYRFIHKLLQEHFAAMPLEGVGNRKTN
ncbi:NACHT domain-containing protein [Scytonema sp. PCC 10023]|uniref:NACHT domain-containing protein n=1 Tax=Scytonema sp. PCC 10023 TaxID=1680591 RepID=UPI0039C71143